MFVSMLGAVCVSCVTCPSLSQADDAFRSKLRVLCMGQCVCVCVCVCERERERRIVTTTKTTKNQISLLLLLLQIVSKAEPLFADRMQQLHDFSL